MLVMAGAGHSQIFMMLHELLDCTRSKCIELPLVALKRWVAGFQTILHPTKELCLLLLELPLMAGCWGNLGWAPV